MDKVDYLDLIKCRFLSQYGGSIQSYWGKEERERFHKYSDINKKLLLQLEIEIDFNNLIILFPTSLPYGSTALFGNNPDTRFPIDHCTNIVTIRDFLSKKGITYKNNISMTLDKYSQLPVSMLIIQNGIAYINTITSNPFSSSIVDDNSKFCSEIKISSEDSKSLILDNKQIIFSGFVIQKINELCKN